MYRFYLDKIMVEEPESFTNISFEKKRDDKYFGFILRKKGIVKVVGAGQVKFTEPKAVSILKAAKVKDGYGAIVKFTVYYEDKLAYEGTVNLWSAEWYSESVVVTFSDDATAVKFATNASTKYQVSTTTTQTLGSSGIVGSVTHKINPSLTTFRKKTYYNEHFSHAIPFQVNSGSTNASVGEITSFDSIKPIYVNDSERKTISIKASVFVNARAAESITVNINDLIVNQYALTNTATNYIFLIDKQIVVEPYQTVTIKVVSLLEDDDVQFIYDAEKSVLSISEVKGVVDTDVKCVSSYDLVNSLVKKCSDNELSLSSTFLSSLKHDWTNGKNLRGVDSVLTTSFDDIFSELNKMYCLFCTVTDKEVIIERRSNIVKLGSKSYLNRGRISSEVELPNSNFLFSTINVGYKNWQLDSALSNQEVNSLMVFSTNIFGRQNPLNLECESITSGILIEEIRQMQFGKISNEQQKKFDETLVSLIPNDGKENYMTFNVNEDAKNLSIRPSKILRNWSGVVGGHKEWVFTSGIGNYSALVNGVRINEPIYIFGNIISDALWDITYYCELWEYSTIGDVIYWTDTLGNKRKGILMEAQWRTNKQMVLTIIEIK